MTMDIYQRAVRGEDNISNGSSSPASEICHQSPMVSKKSQRTTKRSFDVAFLMAPDDLSKKREQKLRLKRQLQLMQEYPRMEKPPEPINPYHRQIMQNEINPLSLMMIDGEKLRFREHIQQHTDVEQKIDYFVRSAFTKVTSSSLSSPMEAPHPLISIVPPPIALSPSSVSSTTSCRSGISPDLTYQDSLSPRSYTPNNRSPVQMIPDPKTRVLAHSPALSHSPGLPRSPVLSHSPALSQTSVLPQPQPPILPHTPGFQYFVASHLNSNHNQFRIEQKIPTTSEYIVDPAHNMKQRSVNKSSPPTEIKSGFPFAGDGLPLPYGGFAMAPFPFAPGLSHPTTNPMPIFPAAAALLPSSLAALTLPAQNVCAKCNMNFRMTSDLVYHMRSHHKNEYSVADPYKKRREQDKLKCTVCNESFRERHHLTRHMTAHQDKEGDEEISQELADISTRRGQNVTTAATSGK